MFQRISRFISVFVPIAKVQARPAPKFTQGNQTDKLVIQEANKENYNLRISYDLSYNKRTIKH